MKTTISIIIASTFLMLACKKENTTAPACTPSSPTSTNTVEGMFIAYHTVQSVGDYWGARVTFWESSNSVLLIDGDSVFINSNCITTNAGVGSNMQQFREWLIPPSPLDFSSLYYWQTTGNAKVPAINHSNVNLMPYMDASFLTTSTVSKALGVTITHPNINSTKTEYKIFKPSASGGALFLLKTVVGNSTGVTFSASELAAMPTGTNSAIRIVAYSDEVISPQAAVNFTFSNQCQLQKGSITITN
jgi:hypothetical protein